MPSATASRSSASLPEPLKRPEQPQVDPALRRDPPRASLEWVRVALGATRVGPVRLLTGGISHANHAVTVQSAGGAQSTVVLRRWARRVSPAEADYDVAREVATLVALEDTAVPAPRVLAADPDAKACDVPALILTLLDGGPPVDVPPRVLAVQLAEAAHLIHAVAPAPAVPAYRPYNDPAQARPPAASPEPALWGRAIALAVQPPGDEEHRFLHRDFHPGNTLWVGDRMTGVVDWTAASLGPAALDVAHMRWNLAVNFGHDVARYFTEHYLRSAPEVAHTLAWWDAWVVVDLLEHDPGWPFTPTALRRLEDHLRRTVG